MKTCLLFVLLSGVFVSSATWADEPPGQARLVTNLVEVLGYIDKFAKVLDIDLPQPLTTNAVSWFGGYRSGCDIVGLRISGRFQFVFNVEYHFVERFSDGKYTLSGRWRATDVKPLIRQRSKITEDQALEVARNCMTRLGYFEGELPPLLPPHVEQQSWGQPGAVGSAPLPYFTIEWRWKENPEWKYCTFEIDGLRQKITEFSVEYSCKNPPPPAEEPHVPAVASKYVVIAGLDSKHVYTGDVEIPVKVHVPGKREVAGVYILMDGQPTMSIVNPGWTSRDPPYNAHWDTTCVSNGWHTLQAFASCPDPSMSSSGGYSEYGSPVVRVRTFNEIVFPDFPTTFGTSLPITALLASNNAAWTVTVRSPSKAVLRTYTGITTNGRIDVFWDSTDSNGVSSYDGESVDIEVTTSPISNAEKTVGSRLSGRSSKPTVVIHPGQ